MILSFSVHRKKSAISQDAVQRLRKHLSCCSACLVDDGEEWYTPVVPALVSGAGGPVQEFKLSLRLVLRF